MNKKFNKHKKINNSLKKNFILKNYNNENSYKIILNNLN